MSRVAAYKRLPIAWQLIKDCPWWWRLSSLCTAGEFCHGESFTASCSIDEVIVMRTALYGRMRIGRCVKTGYSQVGCRTNVMRQADRSCSGRRSCRIQVTSRSFGNVQPCPTDARSYFEVAYECKKGWLTIIFMTFRSSAFASVPRVTV